MPPFTNPIIQVENAGQFFYQCCIAGIMLETVAPSKSVKSWWEFNYLQGDLSRAISICTHAKLDYYKYLLN